MDALAEDYRSLTRRSWRSLQFFVDSCAGLPGRKVILHISDGVPFRPDHWNSPGRNTSGIGDGAPRPESFPRELFAEHAGCGDDSDVPVFIVGMPRAGSTLSGLSAGRCCG